MRGYMLLGEDTMETKRIVEVTLPIITKKHRLYNIVNKNGDTIQTIFLSIRTNRNEFEESYTTNLIYELLDNPMYKATEQEYRTSEWLFHNLVKVLQYDLSEVLDVDVNRINQILPIDIKIEKIRKDERICLKEVN